MKTGLLSILLFYTTFTFAQSGFKTKNIVIVTTDGFRWQEIFTGADSVLINNPQVTLNPELTNRMYWASRPEERRKKLMPFLWNVVASEGQLFGNRLLHNKVTVKNIYKFSYPGYNEILTGFADTRFIPNTPVENRNLNILEYLNQQQEYTGKVAAFSSWNILPFILNEERSHLPVNAGYEVLTEENPDSSDHLLNIVQHQIEQKTHTRFDLLTYVSAMQYMKNKHPKVTFVGLGETDESAHGKRYDLYLQQANMVDKMLSDLWYFIQTDPVYRNQTTLIITTDHGRGQKSSSWNNHNTFIKGSGETWIAMIGPDISALGEIQTRGHQYNNQIAATISLLLGQSYQNGHKIGKPLNSVGEEEVKTAGLLPR